MYKEITPMTSIFISLDSAKLQADYATVFFNDNIVLFEYLGVNVFTDSLKAILCLTSSRLFKDCMPQDYFWLS